MTGQGQGVRGRGGTRSGSVGHRACSGSMTWGLFRTRGQGGYWYWGCRETNILGHGASMEGGAEDLLSSNSFEMQMNWFELELDL